MEARRPTTSAWPRSRVFRSDTLRPHGSCSTHGSPAKCATSFPQRHAAASWKPLDRDGSHAQNFCFPQRHAAASWKLLRPKPLPLVLRRFPQRHAAASWKRLDLPRLAGLRPVFRSDTLRPHGSWPNVIESSLSFVVFRSDTLRPHGSPPASRTTCRGPDSVFRSDTLRPHGSTQNNAAVAGNSTVFRSDTLRPHGSPPGACLPSCGTDVFRSDTLRPHGSFSGAGSAARRRRRFPQRHAAASWKHPGSGSTPSPRSAFSAATRCGLMEARMPAPRPAALRCFPQRHAAASWKLARALSGHDQHVVFRSDTLRPHGSTLDKDGWGTGWAVFRSDTLRPHGSFAAASESVNHS